ncbi:hypothetical protein BU16DRAFT_582792 [Lophium mytilinum]|uniref:Uncharacterized protein n=1 Tax=Lophium mytilinum TaxID=390894 RepID=A0A6A6QNM9_9PEZI|nr:hypothetical protein BU16DRAFT_582792 [Lophium mytilinum]
MEVCISSMVLWFCGGGAGVRSRTAASFLSRPSTFTHGRQNNHTSTETWRQVEVCLAGLPASSAALSVITDARIAQSVVHPESNHRSRLFSHPPSPRHIGSTGRSKAASRPSPTALIHLQARLRRTPQFPRAFPEASAATPIVSPYHASLVADRTSRRQLLPAVPEFAARSAP